MKGMSTITKLGMLVGISFTAGLMLSKWVIEKGGISNCWNYFIKCLVV